MEEKQVKVIYKKSLFQELVKRGHNFLYSSKNRSDPRWQVYMFELTEELERDIAKITGYEYVEDANNE